MFTRRITWPDNPDSRDDYVFRFNGYDVGRCHIQGMAGNQRKWTWAIYFGCAYCAARRLAAVPLDGAADTLEGAQAQFKACFEQYRTAGALKDPREARRAPFKNEMQLVPPAGQYRAWPASILRRA
jgi:hypothetical protein